MLGQTRRKQYVNVNADHEIDGSVQPQKIVLKDGSVFKVDEVRKVSKVAALSQFATTNRYTVVIHGKETFLYEDCGKWFVLMKS